MGHGNETWKPDVLTRAASEALARRIFDLVARPAEVTIYSGVDASTRFARGDAHMVAQRGGIEATIRLKDGRVTTSRLDDTGLEAAVAAVKAAAAAVPGPDWLWDPLGPLEYATPPKLVYASTLTAMTDEARAEVFGRALDATEAAGLIGAGDLRFYAYSHLITSTAGRCAYGTGTYGEFSLTARTRDGTGSGWGWSGYEDWARVQVDDAIARAVELAERSAHPVAVEPGRYTVILEPTAVAELLIFSWNAQSADQGLTAFSKAPRGTNKIGLQMLDERVGIVADPWDPEMPQSTIGMTGEPVRRVVWFDQGVLQDLAYSRSYAREKNREPVFAPYGFRLYVEGAAASLEEMIASTKRGIWVNRLSGLMSMNGRTGLLTGTTRDGTFLIENGKITKPIKNFRFTESPFFVLNKLEAWGEPVRASGSRVVPRLKVRDFNFTSMTEAV